MARRRYATPTTAARDPAKDNGRTIHRHEFDTWDAFIEQVQQPGVWASGGHSRYSAKEFNGNCTWDDAIRFARLGWSEGRERLSTAVAIATPGRAMYASTGRDVAGEYPMIPAAVAGDPMSMITRRRSHVASRPVVRIDYNGTVSGDIDAQCILNRGAAILSIVDAMESQGYSCELRIILKSRTAHYKVEVCATYKRAGEPLDIDQAAFALTHPAVLRRLFFAIVEQHADTENEFYPGYGSPDREAWDDDPASVYIDGATNADRTPKAARERLEAQFAEYLDH